MRRWLVLPLMCAWALAARAQDEGPSTALSLVRLDSLAIAAPGRVTGLAWMGSDTLATLVIEAEEPAAGRPRARLVLQSRAGAVLRSEDVTGVLDRALAWDGQSLWSCGDADDGGARLYQLEPRLLTVRASYTLPGHRPSGLCYDGRFLWLTDRDSGRLERFDPTVNEITRSTPTPAFSPCGLAWDGSHLWVADIGTGRLYRLSGSRRAWSGTVEAGGFLWRGRPVHLAQDRGDLWYLPEGSRWLVRVRIS